MGECNLIAIHSDNVCRCKASLHCREILTPRWRNNHSPLFEASLYYYFCQHLNSAVYDNKQHAGSREGGGGGHIIGKSE